MTAPISKWCKLVGQLKSIVGDFREDASPDPVPLTGRALLKPMLPSHSLIPEIGSAPANDISYAVSEIEVEFTNGRIRHNGQDFVYLLSSVPSVDGGVLNWRIVFGVMRDERGNEYRPGAITFATVPGGEVSLSRVQPVPGFEQSGTVKGDSAFEVAVANGFVGTEQEWLDSLNRTSAVFARGEYSPDKTYWGGDVVTVDGSPWLALASKTVVPERTNLVPNPRFANNRAGWQLGPSSTMSVSGTTANLTVGAARGVGETIVMTPQFDVAADTPYSASIVVKNTGSAAVTVRLLVALYNPNRSKQSEVTIQPSATTKITVEGITNQTSTGARLVLQGGAGGVPTGSTLQLSEPIVEASATVGAYFDGVSAEAKWMGEADNSASLIPEKSMIAPIEGAPGTSDAWLPLAVTAAPPAPVDPPENPSIPIDDTMWDSRKSYLPGARVTHQGVEWEAVATGGRNDPERTNLLTNPRFANNRATWSAGVKTTVQVEGTTATITVNEDRPAGNSLIYSSMTAITPNTTLSGSAVLRNAGTSTIKVRLQVQAYSEGSISTTPVELAPGESKRVTVDGHVATGGTYARLIVVSNGMAAGDVVTVSEPLLEEAEKAGTYFDGSFEGARWTGVADNSKSTMAAVNIPPSVSGEPGVSDSWKRVSQNPEVSVAAPGFPEVDPGPGFKVQVYPGDLSHDRTRFLSVEAPQLRISSDDCQTWQNVHQFDDPVRGVRWLPDGEALVATKKSDNTEAFRVWRSSGLSAGEPSTSTWIQVMQGESVGNGPSHGWSWFVDGNICLVADYGAKDGTDKQARFVYLSVDMGRTWRRIFELERKKGLHVHGVAWDRWWDRIWVTHGDDEDGIYVSDDLGTTWRRVKHGATPNAPYQAVGIYPMEECILLASDGVPNGLWRIPRAQGRNADKYEVEAAIVFNETDGISHLCHSMYRAPGLPGAPVLLAYGAETRPETSMWVATSTGWDAAVIFRDPIQSIAGQGARQSFGPTLRGNIIMTSTTPRDGESGGRTMWRVPWTTAYKNS